MTEIKTRRRQRAYEVVAADISALIQQKYEIGERLPAERELATRFGVSRPTIREALLRLSLAGLVEIKNNSGVYVTGRQAQPFTQEAGIGPFENLEARLLIEPELAALAASRSTEALVVQLADAIAMMRWEYSQGNEAVVGDHRFHLAIAAASGNTTLVNIVDSLWTSQLESEIWNEIHRQMPMRDYWQTWLDDHDKVFEAIKASNPTAARKSMSRHIKNIHTILLRESSPKTKAKQAANVVGN